MHFSLGEGRGCVKKRQEGSGLSLSRDVGQAGSRWGLTSWRETIVRGCYHHTAVPCDSCYSLDMSLGVPWGLMDKRLSLQSLLLTALREWKLDPVLVLVESGLWELIRLLGQSPPKPKSW